MKIKYRLIKIGDEWYAQKKECDRWLKKSIGWENITKGSGWCRKISAINEFPLHIKSIFFEPEIQEIIYPEEQKK